MQNKKCWQRQYSLIFLLFISSWLSQNVFATNYVTDGIDCDGYERVLVGTINGTCLGLVAQASQGYTFVKPRKIIQIPNTKKFLITDMGGWKPNRGTLWLLDTHSPQPVLTPFLEHLNLPHGLALDKSGHFYVGEKHQIIRFKIDSNGDIENLHPVVTKLPAWRGHRHPLTEFILDHQNNLIVNTAAPSDQCKKNDSIYKTCTEFRQNKTSNASLRKYIYDKENDSWKEKYIVLATGLRNSMALAQHKSGTILQAENNMDFEGIDTPFEEINVIEKKKFYGWPYCYDKKTVNPFWRTAARKYCLKSNKYQSPWIVIAPHSAPLDMLYYNGNMFPDLTGKLLLSWHGYRDTGQRIVSYSVDRRGRPIRTRKATYSLYRDNGATTIKRRFPKSQNSSWANEIIHAWNPITGYRPKGRPVGMTVAEDGSIWILDDTNKAVLRLSKGKNYTKTFNRNIKSRGISITDKATANLFKQQCSACHTKLITNNNEVSLPLNWLEKVDGDKYLIETRLFDSTLPQMPPGKTLAESELAIFKDWLKQYKLDHQPAPSFFNQKG